MNDPVNQNDKAKPNVIYNFLGLAITDWWNLLRIVVLITTIMSVLYFFLHYTLLEFDPKRLGISSFRSNNTTIYFDADDKHLEILQLPAHQFWVESDTRLMDEGKIDIRASGLVSISYNQHINEFLNFDSLSYIEFALEFERYFTTDWLDPTGSPIMQIEKPPLNQCESEIIRKSDELKFLVGSNYRYGSVIGFAFSSNIEKLLLQNKQGVERAMVIDSLIAIRNSLKGNDMIIFYVGNSASISMEKERYVISNGEDINDISFDKEDFYSSKLYFAVNDAVISTTADIIIPEENTFCDKNILRCRKKHLEFYEKYSRKHSLWYLDNTGSFNIYVLTN